MTSRHHWKLLGPAAVLLGVGCLFASSAPAQTLEQAELEGQGPGSGSAAKNWDVTLGAGPALAPTYPGASAKHLQPMPLISITYKNVVFLGPFGLGIQAVNWHGLHMGPVLGLQADRRQDFDPHLSGLGNIPMSATAGLFASYRIGTFEVSGTVRQAVTHTNSGLTGLLQFNHRISIIPHRLDLIAGVAAEFGDSRFEQTWFGVSPRQAAQSGLPVYSPGAAVTDIGVYAGFKYRYSDHVIFRALGNVKVFTGVVTSPIVQTRTQTLIGVGVGYHF